VPNQKELTKGESPLEKASDETKPPVELERVKLRAWSAEGRQRTLRRLEWPVCKICHYYQRSVLKCMVCSKCTSSGHTSLNCPN
jgi:hypothetical protein